MPWDCVKKGCEIADVRADRRTAKSIEKYGVSEQALYFDGKYLPVSLIERVRIQPSVYSPGGCCGRGIPVFKMRIDHGGEKPLVLMVEKKENAEKMAERIRSANPSVAVEEYIDPNGSGKPV